MDYKLEELIDIYLLQSLQEKLNDIYSFPSAIIDNNGKVLTAVAWQDICTKFHRINPESEKECIKSDQYILEHLQDANPAVSYKCPHGLIDNATPIIIDGKHLGNFFTGQFFIDEKPEIEFFIQQAKKFGFNEEEYLEAVNKVPVWTKSKLYQYLNFIKGFIEMIAGIGLKNLKEIEANKKIKENERLLEEERLRLSYILEGTNVGTWEWNIKTGETIFNERWAEIIGYTLEEISPVSINTWIKFAHPDDFKKSGALLQRHFDGELEYYEHESRMKHKNGSWVWILDKGKVFERGINGEPVRMAGTHQDITERKKGEETLRQTEQRLRLANKATNDVIWEWDVINDMQQWNEAGITVFGWTEIVEHQVNADWWFQRVHPDDRQRVHDSFFSVVNNPLSDVWTDEYRFLKSDGSYADVLDRGYVQRNELGAAVRMVGAMLDITARKRAEEEIIKAKENAEESERKLKEVQEIAKLGSWELDIKTGIFTFNDNFYKIFHTTAEEMGGYQMSIEDYAKRFVHPDDASKVADETRAAIESGDPDFSRYVEHRILYADGGVGYISVRFFVVKDEYGKTIKTYGVNQDITEKVLSEIELDNYRQNLELIVEERTQEIENINRKLIEEIQLKEEAENQLRKSLAKEIELNKLKNRFISTASHELRTPLTTAYMSIELIERYGKKWDENKISEHHKRIKASVEYLTQIVESLLTMSRAEAGKIEFRPRKTDIAELCNQLVDGLKISDREAHSIKLTCPDNSKLFNVDSSLLNTILLNLLSNSIKYSPAESPIELLINESENKLVIAVNDRGIGIPENDLPHIFEPFHRGENINEARGTGLGLAIVKNAVDLHGGNIRVESQVGIGTSFIVELPV